MLKSSGFKLLVIGLLIASSSAPTVLAGDAYDLTCNNKTCDYKGSVTIGGSASSELISGYCTNEKKFVNIIWKRHEKGPEPIKIWNPQTGQTIDLYKCPDCGEPFFPIKNALDLKYCPKCNQPTLHYNLIATLD